MLIPLLFVFKKFRTNIVSLFVISLLDQPRHVVREADDHLHLARPRFPAAQLGQLHPTWVEVSITLGSFGFFFFWFFGFSKLLPTVPLSELKEKIADEQIEPTGCCETR